MGIDRFTALLTDQENLREVVLFPLMKPLDYTADGEPVEENAENENAVLAPQDVAELGADKAKLDELFAQKIEKDSLKNHSVASAAIMQAVAKKFGLNEENYYYAGLLHDVDFEDAEGSQMDKHGLVGAAWLKDLGVNEAIVHAIMAHNEENGTKRETFMDYALTASETISGFITAVAKIYPDKKVASVKVSSVTKRMKEKAFASNVNRDSILLCSKIGLSLDEFVSISIEAMKAVAEKIGL
jgi:putative nucleotidyltransferase with HDIG domain